MKKLLPGIFCMAIIAASSSCRKTYTCNCEPVNSPLMGPMKEPTYTVEINSTLKKRATDKCDEQKHGLPGWYQCTLK